MLTDKFFVIAEAGHDVTLYILILLSLFSIAFIIERFFFLGSIKKNSARMQAKMMDALRTNNLEDIEIMSKNRESIEGEALSYGVKHIKENGTNGLDDIFNSFALLQKPRLEKRLNFLATVGSNAPFIGLLGTVFGIMDAFRGLATSQGDASAVMIGISKALVATAIGLVVAIPAVIAYNYFRKSVSGILQNTESAKNLCLAYSKSKKG